MPTDIPCRGPLTDAFLEHLQNAQPLVDRGILVGDAGVPAGAGWTGQQPGVGNFVASVRVDTGEAYMRDQDTVRSRHTSWTMNYALKVVGGARHQADDAADLVRAACLSFAVRTLAMGVHEWQVSDVVFTRFGGVTKQDPTDAPTYEVTDTVALWLERRRA